MTVKIFRLNEYNEKQRVDALTCPINRHGTRVENNCDDWELWRNPRLLIEHYIRHGGADAFARRRDEFFQEVQIADEPVAISDELVDVEFVI